MGGFVSEDKGPITNQNDSNENDKKFKVPKNGDNCDKADNIRNKQLGGKDRGENLKERNEIKSARRDRRDDRGKGLDEDIKNNPCPHCEYVTSWPKALKKHLEKMHPNLASRENFKAQYTKKYDDHGSLSNVNSQNNISKTNTASAIFKDLQQCPECPYKTPSIDDINQHISVFHQNQTNSRNLSSSTGKPNSSTRMNLKPSFMTEEPGNNPNFQRNSIPRMNDNLRPFDNSRYPSLRNEVAAKYGVNIGNFGSNQSEYSRINPNRNYDNNANQNYGNNQNSSSVSNQIDNFVNSQETNYGKYQNMDRIQNTNVGNYQSSNIREFNTQPNFRDGNNSNLKTKQRYINTGYSDNPFFHANENHNSRKNDNYIQNQNDENQ